MFDATGGDDEAKRLLARAEMLFDEFHSSSTINERKSAIEVQLKSLLGDARHWRIWTDCLLLTRNQYVVWFCLNCLNDFVSNFWSTWALEEQKNYIKQRLLWYMSTKHVSTSFPSFILTKLLKVFVDIGRNDWPEKYPDFLSHIESFVKEAELRSTGLRMLRLVSEEFISSRTDMSQSRKSILKANLSQRIPTWMELVYTLIHPVVELVTVSPEQISANKDLALALRDTSDALHLLTHVFSWLPGNILVPRPLLDSLFKLASCHPSDASLSDLATSSLSTVAELAGRACMSPDMEKTLWIIYEFAYVRLDSVAAQLTNQEEMSDESDAGFEYYQQFVELIRFLIISHLQRFEQHKDFPTMNFLEKFFRLTFSIPVLDLFLSCVDIWNDFLDRILALASARTSAARQVIIQSYTAPILALVDHLLIRVQFQHNGDQLEELSSDIASQTAGLTEREDFFQRCVNVVIKAGEILPAEVLEKLSQRQSDLQQGYQQLHCLVHVGTNGLTLRETNAERNREAHCMLQDLGIITRTLATHCGLLTGDLFLTFFEKVSAFLQYLLGTLEVLTAALLFTNHHVAVVNNQIEDDYRHFLTCAYQSVEGIFPWIVQFYHQETNDNNQNTAILSTLTKLTTTALRPVMRQPCHAVMLASTKVLCTITKTIRSSEISNMPAVADLYDRLTDPSANGLAAFTRLPLPIQINLASALSNILTLPHSSRGHVTLAEENKNWDERAAKHGQLMVALTRRVDSLPERLNDQDMEVLKSTLALVDGLLLNISEDPKKSKQIMLASLTPFLTTLAGRPERTQILQTVYNVFSSLKSAFPPELTSPLSDLFEKLFEQFLDPEELLRALRSNDPSEVESLGTCFDLLKLVVSDPSYKSYLPMVIMLCHIVCPALNTVTEIRVDFRTASYELLLSVLVHHWTYFFKSVRMVAATNGDGIETTTEEQSEAKDFLVIMQCLGGALLQPEISATQVVLEGSNQLHRTRQIFDKAPFQQALRADFLNALLRLLVHKEKQLLSDDMHLAVYNIASSDFSYFRGQYLTSLLGQWLGGSDPVWQRRVLDGFVENEDQNGFIEQLQNLVVEVRCYLLYRANLVSTSSFPL
ncbi:hypothetical protein RvY_17954 [Ramazzottius varieornatus]|uniref:Exportin-1/Importin-beta-like domain-containing protein n=1 Tax=Ramazzottius varieornatus TaxID=947166 RepID=A0A1D1W415_RAMVA|nr:hypothetical protein RvY_17954 [Ramazzottius varieornatus]